MIEHPVPALQVNTPRPYWRKLLEARLPQMGACKGRAEPVAQPATSLEAVGFCIGEKKRKEVTF
jgi:hypothetical protein